MTQLTPQMRILVAIEPADFRKGIDGLYEALSRGAQPRPVQRLRVCLPVTVHRPGTSEGAVFPARWASRLRTRNWKTRRFWSRQVAEAVSIRST